MQDEALAVDQVTHSNTGKHETHTHPVFHHYSPVAQTKGSMLFSVNNGSPIFCVTYLKNNNNIYFV